MSLTDKRMSCLNINTTRQKTRRSEEFESVCLKSLNCQPVKRLTAAVEQKQVWSILHSQEPERQGQ